uniref:ORF2 n=1 Tax=Torque teno sus virus 1a TaxID=687386 RepID=S4T4M9_9VIRU|nr:ORF2 [Torque teno sus virus 1a]
MNTYWEEAWLTSCTAIHDKHCECGDWKNHLWSICALEDAALVAAVESIENAAGDGGGEEATTADATTAGDG